MLALWFAKSEARSPKHEVQMTNEAPMTESPMAETSAAFAQDGLMRQAPVAVPPGCQGADRRRWQSLLKHLYTSKLRANVEQEPEL